MKDIYVFKISGMWVSTSLSRFLLSEIPLQQPLERLAVTGFVAGHLVHGVVDGIQIQRLGLLGQLGLPGSEHRGRERLYLLVFYGIQAVLSSRRLGIIPLTSFIHL